FVQFPFRGLDTRGWFFVDGASPIIDVDDLGYLSQEALRQNPALPGSGCAPSADHAVAPASATGRRSRGSPAAPMGGAHRRALSAARRLPDLPGGGVGHLRLRL